MQVILIRHSMTPGNAEQRYNGRTDEGLSPEGIALAQSIGCNVDVHRVYVTSLRRTQETAVILFPKAQQIVAEDLREMDFGDFEGHSFAEMEHNAAYRAWVESGCRTACPNGESRKDFSDRVCTAFEAIVKDAAAREEEDMYFVVHGGTIMAIMERFGRPLQDYYSYGVKNCQGYCCQVSFDPLVLAHCVSWNGTP